MKLQQIFAGLFVFIFLQIQVFAQNVAINSTGNAPNASAMLDISSTKSGVLIPRMLESQRNLISSPATGLLIYQTNNTPGFYYYNGSSWTQISGLLDHGTYGTVPMYGTDGDNIEDGTIRDWGGAIALGPDANPTHTINVNIVTNSLQTGWADLEVLQKSLNVHYDYDFMVRETHTAYFENSNTNNSAGQNNKLGVEIAVNGGGSNTPAQYALKTTTSGNAQANYGGNFDVTGANNGYGIATNVTACTGYNVAAHLTAGGGSHNWAIWATTNTATDPTNQAGTHGAYIEGDLWVNKIRGVASNTTLTSEDFFVWVSASCTITLPNATGLDGKIIYVRSIHGGTTTINSASWVYRENIAPAQNFTIGAYGGLRLIASGGSWFSL